MKNLLILPIIGLFLVAAPAVLSAAPQKPVAPKTAAQKLKLDEEFDRLAGLLDQPWTINKINISSRSNLPVQMQPGLPPFSQQPERAQVIPGQPGSPPAIHFKP